MKMTKENFTFLKESIDEVLTKYPNVREEYEQGNFPRSESVNDLQKRYCFDMLYGAGILSWVCDALYKVNDLNDDHIYTALRAICPTVTKRY